MADTSGPWDSVPWAQAQWYKFLSSALPSGVVGSPAGSISTGGLAWSASGLTVTIAVGKAWAGGGWFERDTAAALPIVTSNGTGNPRIDRIVLRRDTSTNSTALARIEGTPAGTPTAPAITRTDAVWDLPLFQFRVPANNGTTLSNVVDERTWITEGTEETPDDLVIPGTGTFGGTVTAADATADTHLVDRGYVKSRTTFKAGSTSKTTDGAGMATITHSLGVTPDIVFITVKTVGVRPYGYVLDSKGSSQFTYRLYYDNGVAANNTHQIDWCVLVSAI